jgi:hypothetical protein
MIQTERNTRRSARAKSMNHYCDIWFWRASDQEAVARHLMDRARSTTAEPDPPQRTGLVLSALLFVLRTTGLAKQPVEASPIEQEETPVRESCDCGGEEFRYREAVLDDGEWVLQCPECGHLDRLLWLSDENRSLLLGLARRRRRVQVRRT